MNLTLEFPGVKGSVWPVWPTDSGNEFYSYSVSWPDGSGGTHSWAPTRRGAMMRAINEARRMTGKYKDVKYRWIPTPPQS